MNIFSRIYISLHRKSEQTTYRFARYKLISDFFVTEFYFDFMLVT